jgi:NTP pyrophosphatase (non-canonical NTP hydrolase)
MISDNLRTEILEFRRLRDWQQFHTPRNLATAISVESAELLEPFRWSTSSDGQDIASARRQEISEELADISILITLLAHDLSINMEEAITRKLKTNAEKYPVDKSRGSSKKYTEL